MEYDWLDLSTPLDLTSYVSQLLFYRRGHSMLAVEVSSDFEKFYFYFEKVLFFSGFAAWKGGKLTSNSSDKYLSIMLEGGRTHMSKNYQLFAFEGTNPEVQIIAENVKKIHEYERVARLFEYQLA